MTEHEVLLESLADGCRALCPCGWKGKERADAEMAIADAQQHSRYVADVARITAPAQPSTTGGAAAGAA